MQWFEGFFVSFIAEAEVIIHGLLDKRRTN
jgi:hypothetical protein